MKLKSLDRAAMQESAGAGRAMATGHCDNCQVDIWGLWAETFEGLYCTECSHLGGVQQ